MFFSRFIRFSFLMGAFSVSFVACVAFFASSHVSYAAVDAAKKAVKGPSVEELLSELSDADKKEAEAYTAFIKSRFGDLYLVNYKRHDPNITLKSNVRPYKELWFADSLVDGDIEMVIGLNVVRTKSQIFMERMVGAMINPGLMKHAEYDVLEKIDVDEGMAYRTSYPNVDEGAWADGVIYTAPDYTVYDIQIYNNTPEAHQRAVEKLNALIARGIFRFYE